MPLSPYNRIGTGLKNTTSLRSGLVVKEGKPRKTRPIPGKQISPGALALLYIKAHRDGTVRNRIEKQRGMK